MELKFLFSRTDHMYIVTTVPIEIMLFFLKLLDVAFKISELKLINYCDPIGARVCTVLTFSLK